MGSDDGTGKQEEVAIDILPTSNPNEEPSSNSAVDTNVIIISAIENLWDAFKAKDDKKFQSILSENFSSDLHDEFNIDGKSNMEEIYYQVLLKSGEVDFGNEKIKQSLNLTEDNLSIVLNILLNLENYQLFQRIAVDKNDDDVADDTITNIDAVETFICKLLGIKDFQLLTVEIIEKIVDPIRFENVVKYLVEFHFEQINQLKSFSFVTKNNDSSFLKLLQAILEGTKKSTLFGKFFNENNKDPSFLGNMNVLLQAAYYKKSWMIAEWILNVDEININKLRIRLENNKRIADVCAEQGFPIFLKLIMERTDFKMKPRIITECIKGKNSCADISNTISITNEVCSRNYDKCIDLIINTIQFESEIKEEVEHKPTKVTKSKKSLKPLPLDLAGEALKAAIEYNDSSVILILLRKGIIKNPLDVNVIKNKNCLKMLLNFFVYEEKSQVTLNLSHLKEDELFKNMANITENEHTKELIKHPVLTSIIEMEYSRTSHIYSINLVLFLLFYIGAMAFGFYYEKWYLVLIAGVYLILQEFVQCYCHVKSLKSSVPKKCLLVKIGLFLMEQGNLFDFTLILTTMGCAFSMFIDEPDMMFCKFLTFLLTGLNFFILLAETWHAFAKKVFMFQTVLKSVMEIALICAIYIITFGLSFRVVFRSEVTNKTTDDSSEDANTIKNYESYTMTFLKMLIMLSGEFDASEIKFDTFSSVIFIIIFIPATISLFNLILGLVVNDVQKIEEEAEFQDYKLKVLTIAKNINLVKIFESDKKHKSENCMTRFISCFFPKHYRNFHITESGKTIDKGDHKIKIHSKNSLAKKSKGFNFNVTSKTYSRLERILEQRKSRREQENFTGNVDTIKTESSVIREDVESLKNSMDAMNKIVLEILQAQNPGKNLRSSVYCKQ